MDVFLELSCFYHDPEDVGNLISGSSAFSKTSLNIREFIVHILLKPGLENFEHYFTSMWDECNCAVVWAFFCIAFLWNWNENWPFPVLWPLMSFPSEAGYYLAYHGGNVAEILNNVLQVRVGKWVPGENNGGSEYKLFCCKCRRERNWKWKDKWVRRRIWLL